ncbi:MAG: neutral/alkaline non-lysosomal ceramidase N-terminal domain-containing protein [Planctomycetaceae bacterium]
MTTVHSSSGSKSQTTTRGAVVRFFQSGLCVVAARISVLAIVLLYGGHAAAVADDSGWQAGVARTVITPQKLMWMSGYASRDKPAEGKLHDLWAKALVMRDAGGHDAVLVTLDLIGIDRDTSREICETLQTVHGLQRSQIALATSHTHTGPVVGENLGAMYSYGNDQAALVRDYRAFLIQSVVDVVAKAYQDVAPAALSYGRDAADFAVNRRNNREPDVPALREAGQLQGPVDHAAPVLVVRGSDGTLKTIVFGYACHATVLSFFQWSGDWPGFAQIEIERRHPTAVAMFVAGCGADQNPLPRRTVELAEEYGRDTADAVDRVLASDMKKVTGSLRTAYREIDLAFGELPSQEQLELDASSDNVYIARRAKLLLQTIASQGRLAATYPYPVQAWAIGDDARTVILGGEVVVDFSLRLKAEIANRDLWIAGYSNDVMAYIPSLRVLREGGYEGASSMIYYGQPTIWSEVVEEHIIATAKSLLESL